MRGAILLIIDPGRFQRYPDASLFNAALDVATHLSTDLGIPAPTAVSQRDVPGWTRAAIPLLAKRGIHGLSFGAGTYVVINVMWMSHQCHVDESSMSCG